MTASLLDHELVRKYFGDDSDNYRSLGPVEDRISARILTAMQEPIRKGERYLKNISHPTDWYVYDNQSTDIFGFHPYALRLPDRFQKRGEESHCDGCRCTEPTNENFASSILKKSMPSSERCPPMAHPGQSSCPNCRPKDAVEEKIDELAEDWRDDSSSENKEFYVKHLRALVALARKHD